MGAISNNPAGRLLYHLEAARARLAGVQRRPASKQHTDSIHFWGEVLDVAPDQFSEAIVTERYAMLLRLVDDIESAVKNSGLDAKVYLAWLPSVRRTLLASFGPGANFRDRINALDESTWALLRVCDDLLGKTSSAERVEKSSIENLRNLLSQIVRDLPQVDLASNVRDFLIRQLDVIDRCLVEAHFFGARSLKLAASATLGSIVVEWRAATELEKTPIGKSFFKLVGATCLVVQGLSSGLELPGQIADAFPSLAGEIETGPSGGPATPQASSPIEVSTVEER